MKTVASLPEFRELAIGNILFKKIAEIAENKNFKNWIFAFMYSNNSSQKMAKRNNTKIIRKYALYGKEITQQMSGNKNLVEKLIINFEKNPNKICLIQNSEKINYRELYFKVLNYKEHFEKAGIKNGQKILVLINMSVELYITLLAIWSIGAIPCFMDAGFIKNNINKNKFEEIDGIVRRYEIYFVF